MTKKRRETVWATVATLGFLLLLGTAGGSDCGLLTLPQAALRGGLGLVIFAGGLWMGGFLDG